MIQPERQFDKGARVRLRDGVWPGFYNGFALRGNEGTIRRLDRDKFGYPRVYIEWDKDHWSYNGAPDGWTYENHFELVEDVMSKEKKNRQEAAKDIAAKFAEEMAALFGDEEPEVGPEIVDDSEAEESSPENEYDEILDGAYEAAKECDAFILTAVKIEGDDESDTQVFMPITFLGCHTKLDSLLIQRQVIELSDVFAKRSIENRIKQEIEEGSDG